MDQMQSAQHGNKPIMIPSGFNLMSVQVVQVVDPFQILQMSPTCVIQQQINLFNMIGPCEMPQRYDVFCIFNGVTIRLFRCRENSGFCVRQCCHPDCRSFMMDVKYVGNMNMIDDDFTAPVALLNRPFACSCACFCRPEMQVTWMYGGNQTIGIVRDPWTCCNLQFNVFDAAGEQIYRVEGSCCQLGMNKHCKCLKVVLDIYKAGTDVACGAIIKTERCSSCITQADTFNIFFPPDANAAQKMLLISATLMADYQHFENQDKNDDVQVDIQI